MAKFYNLPKIGLAQNAIIANWEISEGTSFKTGDIILNAQAGKMAAPCIAEEDATLLKVLRTAGTKVNAGSPIAIIGEPSDDISELLAEFEKLVEEEKIPATKLCVIGGGPGGYVAAIRAAQLGAEVTLIENKKLGGTCLNEGCIPTKALLKCSSTYHEIANSALFGISAAATVDIKQAVKFKQSVTDRLVSGITTLMKANSIEVIYGEASFEDEKHISIKTESETQSRTFDKYIIATGSVNVKAPVQGFDLPCCIDSTQALELKEIPKSLVIIGGGVIGMEMATAYADFGSKITVIEMLPQVLSGQDEELVAMACSELKKKSIEFYVNTKVGKVEFDGEIAKVFTEGPSGSIVFEGEKVLVCTGRRANTANLNLEKAGIKTEKARIIAGDDMATNVPGIYAIGDCSSSVMLAHIASAQGEIAAENALSEKRKLFNAKNVPSCIFINPELASVGMTEAQAKAAGIACITGKFNMASNGKTIIENDGIGMVKIVAEPNFKRVIGVQILGPHASDLITESALAIKMGAKASDIIDTIHAHPTIGESVREAALSIEGRAIHS